MGPNGVIDAASPYAADQADIQKRRSLAAMLQQQMMTPEPTQMSGGWATRQNPLNGLSKIGMGLLANKQADEKQKELGDRYQSDYRSMLARGLQQLRGTEQTIQPDPQEAQQSADQGTPPIGPANVQMQAPDPMGAAFTFAQHPGGQALMPLALGQMPQKPMPYTLKEGETRFDDKGQPIAFGQFKPDKAEGFNLPPGQTRYDAQGKPIVTAPDKPAEQQPLSLATIVDPKDPTRMLQIDARRYKGGSVGADGVIGISGKEPTAAKREEQLAGGKEQVDSLVSGLRDFYTQLQTGGGINDPAKGVGPNIKAGVASSDVGQAFGRMFGTENQSLRNSIAQQRPLLLNAIKNATGMSAKQMDSNAELKLYLASATDPKLDIKANLAALDKLESMFGSGGKGGAPAVGSVQNGYRFKGGDPSKPENWEKQ